MKELGSNREYTPEQCKAQLRLLEAKQYLRDLGSASPSAMSDPAVSPTLSRKRTACVAEIGGDEHELAC